MCMHPGISLISWGSDKTEPTVAQIQPLPKSWYYWRQCAVYSTAFCCCSFTIPSAQTRYIKVAFRYFVFKKRLTKPMRLLPRVQATQDLYLLYPVKIHTFTDCLDHPEHQLHLSYLEIGVQYEALLLQLALLFLAILAPDLFLLEHEFCFTVNK